MHVSPLHIDLVYRTYGHGIDGIRDYTAMLAQSLEEVDGVAVAMYDLRSQQDDRDLVQLSAPTSHYRQAIVVQYNPFSYGRWGCAPWLVRALRRLRTARPNTAIVLLAHELFVEIEGPRNAVLGVAQRGQFAALSALSDVVLTTTEPFARRAQAYTRRPAAVLPVGSNLPDRRAARTLTRHALAIDHDQVVVGLFGRGHWTRMFDLLDRTIKGLAAGRRLVVLNLGSGAPAMQTSGGDIVVHTPGELELSELAGYLSAVDVLLLPFVDGASTRRTTLMAGLQHAIPILTTDGPSTGPLLRARSALALLPVEGANTTFFRRAETLVDDAKLRGDLARGGRRLFEQHFAWPVLAQQLLRHIDSVMQKRQRSVRDSR